MEELAASADAEADIAGAHERRKQVDVELEGINQQLSDSVTRSTARQHVLENVVLSKPPNRDCQRQSELNGTNNEATQHNGLLVP